jgi:hypothetical protein
MCAWCGVGACHCVYVTALHAYYAVAHVSVLLCVLLLSVFVLLAASLQRVKTPSRGRRSKLGMTPLMYSALNGHIECTRVLIGAGADIGAKGTHARDVASMLWVSVLRVRRPDAQDCR